MLEDGCEKFMNKSDQHDRSASVSERRKRPRTQPALDVRSRWLWTEGSVWTDRMLTALEQGVKGGKIPTLPIAGFSIWYKPVRRPVNPF